MLSESDFFIVLYYNKIAFYLLNYFRCVDNFYKIQNIVSWFLRSSLISTIKHKHKLLSSHAVIQKFGVSLKVSNAKGFYINFLTTDYIFRLKKMYLFRLNMFNFFDY